MAYDKHLEERVTRILKTKHHNFFTKKMMGGLCYMLEDKMLCGLLTNKEDGTSLLMARVGPEFYNQALKNPGCMPMNFTKRPMKGFVFITEKGIDKEEDLEFWVQKCLDFNPFAKSSKKKK